MGLSDGCTNHFCESFNTFIIALLLIFWLNKTNFFLLMLRQSYIFKYMFDSERRYCLQHLQPVILFLHCLCIALTWNNVLFLSTSFNQGTLDHCFRCNSSPSSQVSISIQSFLICSVISGEASVFSNCSWTRCFSLTWFTSDPPMVLVHSISPWQRHLIF